jgi:YfiH family protein
MKTISTYKESRGIEERAGLIYQKFAPLEKFSFLEHGFILGYKDGRRVNSGDIPRLISTVTEIPEEKFNVVIPKQIHQAEVKIFKERFPEKIINLECDALITDQENLFLVVQVADCLPVFLANSKSQVLGLAHIGRRGALLGMAERFVKQASASFDSAPQDMNLILGPSIGKCCYKISDSLAVLIDDKYMDERVADRYLDLSRLVKDKFLKSGVREENIFVVDKCTCCGDKLYQSFRRDREKAGRMVAFIGK